MNKGKRIDTKKAELFGIFTDKIQQSDLLQLIRIKTSESLWRNYELKFISSILFFPYDKKGTRNIDRFPRILYILIDTISETNKMHVSKGVSRFSITNCTVHYDNLKEHSLELLEL